MTITDRRDNGGKMSACNNLKQYGIPYSLTTLHTEAPDFDQFAKDLNWFAAVCRVVRACSASAQSGRASAFNTVRYSEKLLEASGISIEPYRLGDPRTDQPDEGFRKPKPNSRRSSSTSLPTRCRRSH